MMSKSFIFVTVFIFCVFSIGAAEDQTASSVSSVVEDEAAPQESDQTISDFSLAGYGEKGKKTWDLAGKTADIFVDVVKLSDVVGNLYGKEEDIRLTADQGDFNKVDGKVHLEDNVVITTSTGTKMLTNSLDWDRKNQQVNTEDVVCIKRDTMVATAKGAWGNPTLKTVSLKKNVRLDILTPEKGKEPTEKDKITITCDGPLEIDYAQNLAKFKDNVKVDREDSQIYSDTMDVYFISGSSQDKETGKAKEGASPVGMMGSKIDKMVAKGHVRIIRGENVSTSEEAIYSAADKKLTLMGKPELMIYSTEGLSGAPAGN